MPHRSSFAGSYSVVSSPYPARRDPSLWATGYGAASSTALTVDPRARMGTAAGQQYQPQPQAYSHLGAFQAGARSSPASSHWQQPALGTPGAPHPAFDEPFLDLYPYPYPHPHPAVPYQSSSAAAAYPFVDDDFAYSTFDLSDEDLFGPSSAVAAAAPQTIFRGLLPTAPAPITPPSPVTSDVGRHRNDMVGQGSPWHFHQAPAQPLAYPSSSMRQGAAAAAPAPGGADPSFDADEREIEHFLALDGLLSPAHPSDGSSADRVHHSRSYTPSPSSGSHRSHTSFAFLCGPTSAAPASPISSDSLANLKPWALDMSADGLSPTYAPVPSTSSGRGALLSPEDDLPGARRPRAVRLANAGGGSAKRERDDGEGSSSASAANLTSVKRIKVKTESQSTSIAPAPASSPTVKVGKRKGKAPSSCAECRRCVPLCFSLPLLPPDTDDLHLPSPRLKMKVRPCASPRRFVAPSADPPSFASRAVQPPRAAAVLVVRCPRVPDRLPERPARQHEGQAARPGRVRPALPALPPHRARRR